MSTPSLAPASASWNLPQRIWHVFLAPSRVFQQLRERPRLLGMILVLVVVQLVAGALAMDLVEQSQIEKLSEMERLTPEQIQQQAKIAKYSAPLVGPVFTVVGLILLPALALLVLGKAQGGTATYKQLTAGLAHVTAVIIPETIIKLPIMLSQGRMDIQFSLAALLSEDQKKTFLYNLLAQVDVFQIWRVWLAALALSILGGIPMKKSAVGVFSLWAAWSLLAAVLGTVMKGFGQ
jgi:hypothetical protein